MRDVKITPARLHGSVTVPPSKSAAHRAILCAALANGVSEIHNISLSDDMCATIGAIQAMGARVHYEKQILKIDTTGSWTESARIDCGESGSTLRFFIPIAAALGMNAEFTGRGRLPQRPIGVYLDCLPPHGIVCQTEGGLPLRISGQLTPGRFVLPGNISSQFITGLLLALPLLNGDSELLLSSPLESAAYVDMTIAIQREFGIQIEPTKNGWSIRGRQSYHPRTYTVEGDWSQAAFFLAAGALGGELSIQGLNRNSTQGDKAAEALFAQFGADIAWRGDILTVKSKSLCGMEIDAAQIPDLVPILAATAALCEGNTRIYHAERLRIKESDRLAAMTDGLTKLGANIQQTPDGLLITGVPRLHADCVQGYNDHRIVMALAIAALNADGEVQISDAQSIQKSYPQFFEDYNRLGGNADVVNLG